MKEPYKKSALSLYKHFKPGDRVKRSFQGDAGKSKRYEGIIMSMDHDKLEIYWDKIDGMYCPDLIEKDFTMCSFDEVMNGNYEFTPLKHKKSYLFD
ncbi:MAG: hypothetical protein DRN27_01980 [Thermoplasmata archaeon]|nr:MAG: hypothetical protein DRN27_01980 [Thermoplasmata archaeon]